MLLFRIELPDLGVRCNKFNMVLDFMGLKATVHIAILVRTQTSVKTKCVTEDIVSCVDVK